MKNTYTCGNVRSANKYIHNTYPDFDHQQVSPIIAWRDRGGPGLELRYFLAWKGILVGMVGLRSLLCLEFSKYIRRFPNSVFYLFKNGYIWLYDGGLNFL